MYKLSIPDENTFKFSKKLSCSWIGVVKIIPKPLCKEFDCHNNVLKYCHTYGGNKVLGYYFIQNEKQIVAILHSVVEKEDGELLDITPFDDGRIYHTFARLKEQNGNYKDEEIFSLIP